MKFGITGASSDIGKSLDAFLTRHGHQVVKFGRSEQNYWELGKEFPESDIEVLFHLAHDRSFTFEENRRAVNLLASSYKKKIVYISTTSAHPSTISNYGKSKYMIQEIIQKAGGVAVVAGLIYGKSRMAETSVLTKLSNMVNKSRIILLPFVGESKLYFSEINKLTEALYIAAIESQTRTVKAFSSQSLSLLELLHVISSKDGSALRVIKIPDLGFSSILMLTSKFIAYPSPVDSILSLINEMPQEYIDQLRKIPGLDFPIYS